VKGQENQGKQTKLTKDQWQGQGPKLRAPLDSCKIMDNNCSQTMYKSIHMIIDMLWHSLVVPLNPQPINGPW